MYAARACLLLVCPRAQVLSGCRHEGESLACHLSFIAAPTARRTVDTASEAMLHTSPLDNSLLSLVKSHFCFYCRPHSELAHSVSCTSLTSSTCCATSPRGLSPACSTSDASQRRQWLRKCRRRPVRLSYFWHSQVLIKVAVAQLMCS